MSKRLWAVSLVLALSCALGVERVAQAQPASADEFVKPPVITKISLSPSGHRMAVVARFDGGPPVAAVMGLAPLAPIKVVAAFNDADVDWVGWVNDDRLVFTTWNNNAAAGFQDTRNTYAVNHDGSDQVQLIAHRRSVATTGTLFSSRVLTFEWSVAGTFDDGGVDVLVERRFVDGEGDQVDRRPARLNTLTGVLARIGDDLPAGSSGWLFDAKGDVRALNVVRDGRHKVFWRDSGQKAWTQLDDFDQFADTGYVPLYLEHDGQLVVLSRQQRDTTALFTYDPKTRQLSPKPLLALDGFDVDALLVRDTRTRRVVGARVEADRPLTVWFDARLAGIQSSVDAALPAGRFNRLYCARCETTRFVVIGSSSDRQPGEFYLYDDEKKSLQRIGAVRPWIKETSQGKRSFHRVNARDGLPLPVYVTHPVGSKVDDPLPAVLLVHGGPFVRGASLEWSSEAQFLATRGYRVIEPEFRGSDGYGWAHFRAGWRQYGLAMQDDLADVVKWAADQRLVDPKRVCIFGASYGGYAALMGPVKHPEVYRCAASFAGVTDLDLLFSSVQSDITKQSRRFGLPKLLGERGSVALRENSPVHRVGDIKVPVLLAHGGMDRRVPIEHANAFTKAARDAGVKLVRVDYPHQVHGWLDAEQHADFLKRLERFLAESLAP